MQIKVAVLFSLRSNQDSHRKMVDYCHVAVLFSLRSNLFFPLILTSTSLVAVLFSLRSNYMYQAKVKIWHPALLSSFHWGLTLLEDVINEQSANLLLSSFHRGLTLELPEGMLVCGTLLSSFHRGLTRPRRRSESNSRSCCCPLFIEGLWCKNLNKLMVDIWNRW